MPQVNSFEDYSPKADSLETTSRLHRIACFLIVNLHRMYNKCIYKSVFLFELNILISKKTSVAFV